jgi:2'-5' RNA ligase
MIRLFVAVPLPDTVRETLQKLSRRLQDEVPFQKWTHPADLHITLQFLGDTPDAKLGDLQETLQDVAAVQTDYSLSLSGLGAFGPPARPSILWTGLKGDTAQLEAVHRAVVAATSKHGYEPEDRPFRPHITLARRYNGSGPFSKAALAPFEKEVQGSEWTADRITLYRSHLGRTPMYEAVAEYSFSK